METKKTDRDLLAKGLKKLAISLVLMFVGPTLFFIITTNKDKPFYIPLLIISILLCVGAVFMAFKGIQTVMTSVFGEKKSNSI